MGTQENEEEGLSRLLRMLPIVAFSLGNVAYSHVYSFLNLHSHILKTTKGFKNSRWLASASKYKHSSGSPVGNSGKIPWSSRECGKSPRIAHRRACDLLYLSLPQEQTIKILNNHDPMVLFYSYRMRNWLSFTVCNPWRNLCVLEESRGTMNL